MDRNIKYWLFVATILASQAFFNYRGMVTPQLQKAVYYLCILASTVVAFRDGGSSLKEEGFPTRTYAVLMCSMCFSTVMATVFHLQGFLISVMSALQCILAYGYLIVLLRLDLTKEKIMRTYMVLCGVSTFVYFCNVLTMPSNIFGEPIISLDMSRGVVRLPVVFIEFFPMLVFYAINKWFETNEKKWFGVMAWAGFMIFMSVIRQIIALTGILGLLFLFRKASFVKKLGLVVLVLVTVTVVLPQIPMYKTMVELSEDQRDENENVENIRIQAWRFYTYENQENVLTAIFGNGMPSIGNSIWGLQFESEAEVTGLLTHDVGWAGFYWFFGIFAVAALLILLIKTLLRHKGPQNQYLNYWYIFIMITSVASAPILYPEQILTVMVGIAMAYLPDKEGQTVETKKEDDEEDRTDNTQLQQLPRYPQLH